MNVKASEPDDRIGQIGRLVEEILAERTGAPVGGWFVLAGNDWAISSDGEVSPPDGPVEAHHAG